MLLKWDYIPCSAKTRVNEVAWKARTSLDCLRVPSVFETVTATTMVSKKMNNRSLMNPTRKYMIGIWNVTRDVSPLKVVLIEIFSRNLSTYNRRFFRSMSVSTQPSLTATYCEFPLKLKRSRWGGNMEWHTMSHPTAPIDKRPSTQTVIFLWLEMAYARAIRSPGRVNVWIYYR